MGVAFRHLSGIFQVNAALEDTIVWHSFLKLSLSTVDAWKTVRNGLAQIWFYSFSSTVKPIEVCLLSFVRLIKGSHFWKLQLEFT